MAHSLILGMTESGKTTLAKELSRLYKSRGIGVLVLDPIRDSGWQCDFITDNPQDFLNVYWKSQGCMVFIDESGDSVGRYETAMIRTATKGRHCGHSNHYITQRASSIALTVRDQCSHLFLFQSGIKDCKLHAEEWNRPELIKAANLQRGHYYHATRYGECSLNRIF